MGSPDARPIPWMMDDYGMVGFAPAGVTVTVFAGEGFESERCGVWTKIG